MTLKGHPWSLNLILAPIESAMEWFSIVISNLGPILPRFGDIRAFARRQPRFSIPYPYSGYWCSLWRRSMMLGSTKSEHPRLTNSEIIFEVFQPT